MGKDARKQNEMICNLIEDSLEYKKFLHSAEYYTALDDEMREKLKAIVQKSVYNNVIKIMDEMEVVNGNRSQDKKAKS